MKLYCRQKQGEQVHSTDKTDFVVGRLSKSSEAEIQIVNDPSISRRQIRIWMEDAQVWLEDLGSTWGTRVNGETVEEKTQISDLDRIQIGDTIVTVSLESGDANDNPKGEWEGCRSRTVLPGHLGGE
ncbi:MAG: FHA domain-containing protein [Limisphaerales bacterium]